jgi:pyruvate/2-oxoglutarate/acetoin dehydrogenase E1 component
VSADRPDWADGEFVFRVPGNRARVPVTFRADADTLHERLQSHTSVPLEIYKERMGWAVAPIQPYDDEQDA